MDLGLDKFQGGIDRFSKLPKPYRMAMVPLAALLVLGGYAWLFYLPAAARIDAAETQERDLERKVSEVRSIVANLSAFEAELGEMEQRLKQALRQLPDSKELPGLLTDVTSLGKDAGLEFKAFRPHEEVPRDFYAEVPIEIEFSGDYHDIARFFDKVSKLPRIVNVSELNMEIADQKSNSTRLQVKGEATTFRFIEQPAPAANAAPSAAKKPGAAPAAPAAGRKS
jgi:type IV pilus assembly protein PilO